MLKKELLQTIGRLRRITIINETDSKDKVLNRVKEVTKDLEYNEELFINSNNLVKFVIKLIKRIQDNPDKYYILETNLSMVIGSSERLLSLFIDYENKIISVNDIPIYNYYEKSSSKNKNIINWLYWIVKYNNEHHIIDDPIVDDEKLLKEKKEIQTKNLKCALEHFGRVFQNYN